MSNVVTLRNRLCLFCLVAVAACGGGGGGSATPAASPKPTATPTSVPLVVPGNGLGGSTNIAYVPAYVDDSVYIWSFAAEVFESNPIVDTPGATTNASTYSPGSAISFDGSKLYVWTTTTTAAANGAGTATAYAVSNTGSHALGSISGTFTGNLGIVPTPLGLAYAFSSTGSGTYSAAIYTSDLNGIIAAPANLPLAGGFAAAIADPVSNDAYVVDQLGNLDKILGSSILATIPNAFTLPADNFALPAQQLVAVRADGLYAYTYQTVTTGQTTEQGVINVISTNPLAIVQQIPVPLLQATALFANAATNTLYVIGSSPTPVANDVILASMNTQNNTVTRSFGLPGITGAGGAALSADGTQLMIQGGDGIASHYTVFNAATGALLATSTIPATVTLGDEGGITTH